LWLFILAFAFGRCFFFARRFACNFGLLFAQTLLLSLFSFELSQGLLLELSLFLFSLSLEHLFDLFALLGWPHLKLLTNRLFERNEEIIHHFGMSLHNLAVLRIVVSVSSLDRIKDAKAVIQLLVEHDVVDGLFHLVHFLGQLVLLA
jgi:hypothetical protein